MSTVTKRTWKTRDGTERQAFIIRYMAADPEQNGKRRQFVETFPTKREATARETEINGNIIKGTHTPASTSKTIASAAADWLRQAETDGLERSTRRQYAQHVAHIVSLIGTAKLSEFRVANVKHFRNALAARCHSRVMQKKIVSSLGSILADAQSSGAVGQNVVHAEAVANKTATRRRRLVEKRTEEGIREGVDYPTKAELRAMLALAENPTAGPGQRPDGRISPRNRVLVHFAVATGLRASELRGLEWRHVDLDQVPGTVRVEQRADRWNIMGAPKSAAGRRTVQLDPDMVLMLREWKLRCPRRSGELVLVFPNKLGKTENLPSLHNRALVQIQRAAGILDAKAKAPKYGMHSFRHVAISVWIEAGLSPKEVQTLAGHSTIQMTFDVYGHLWKDGTSSASQKMAKALARLRA